MTQESQLLTTDQRSDTWLLEWKSNTYSQCGEDGVIGKILDTLPETDGWCVEFGAWDGEHLSTTCNLIRNRNYSAVLIEADSSKFERLRANHPDGNVIALNRFVGFGPDDKLDSLLRATPIPRNFDFLSIDIDGNDYHVWHAVDQYVPKVVCIEFNPTIPTVVKFIQQPDPSVQQGCSLSALVELGNAKGYELVAVLPWNAIFVRAEYFPRFGIANNSPERLRTHLEEITHMFIGYDGSVHLSGGLRLPWHGIHFDESMFQVLPRALRKCPTSYSWYQRRLFDWYRRVRAARDWFLRPVSGP